MLSEFMPPLNHVRDIYATTNVFDLSGQITDVITISDRLKAAREESGLTQGQLAVAAGVTQGTISNVESGLRKNPRELLAIAKALGVSPDWLKTGKGTTSNVISGPTIRGQVPLISWVRAGELCESHDNYAPGDAEHWLDCPVPHGPRTYCLELSGDSMDDGSHDAYRDGDIIFVDPDASADPGRDVVVRTPENKTTFKRLKEDQEGQYLLGLNGKKIVRVPEGTEFCGVVIFSGRRR